MTVEPTTWPRARCGRWRPDVLDEAPSIHQLDRSLGSSEDLGEAAVEQAVRLVLKGGGHA